MSDQSMPTYGFVPETIELRALLAVLRRQARVMLYSAAICFGLACLFLAVVPARYSATALLMVEPTGRDVMRQTEVTAPNGSSESARIESEAEILRSTSVALSVIEDLALSSHPDFQKQAGLMAKIRGVFGAKRTDNPTYAQGVALTRYQDAMNIRRRGLTYLISVEAKSTDPALAMSLANRTAEIYIDQHLDGKIQAALAGRDVLTSQISMAMDRLRATEDTLDDFITQEFQDFGAQSSDFNAFLAEFKALRALSEDQAALTELAQGLVQGAEWAAAADLLKDDQLRALARDKIGADPTQMTLAEIDAKLRDRAERQIQTLSREVTRLEQKTSALRHSVRQSIPTESLSSTQLTTLYSIGKEADIAREQYQSLLSRMRDLETEAGLQLANARIVSPAVMPNEPSFPNRSVILLLALAASVGLGVSTAFLSEYFIGGVTTETQLGEVLGLPASGAIPFVAEENAGRLTPADRVVDEPLSFYSESFRKLRATIDLDLRTVPLPEGGAGRIIAITSARPEEGKTTAALALARTYATAGRKTLLIDCDLRQPSLHRQIGVAPTIGLGDYLRDPGAANGIRDFYARDPASPLALVLGSAPAMQTTDQLLVSDAFDRIIRQAREVYEVVILDTPPVLPIVDSRYIVPQADVVVMLAKWASTSQSDLRAAALPIRQAMTPSARFLPVLSQFQARPGFTGYDQYGY